MMYLENLQNPMILAAIPVICGALVQVIKPIIGTHRLFWLPFISVVTGIVLTFSILFTPPELITTLITVFSGLLPSAAISLKKEMSEKKEVAPEIGNPPDHL